MAGHFSSVSYIITVYPLVFQRVGTKATTNWKPWLLYYVYSSYNNLMSVVGTRIKATLPLFTVSKTRLSSLDWVVYDPILHDFSRSLYKCSWWPNLWSSFLIFPTDGLEASLVDIEWTFATSQKRLIVFQKIIVEWYAIDYNSINRIPEIPNHLYY